MAQDAAASSSANCFQYPSWVDAVALARRRRHEFVAIRAALGPAPAFLFGSLHRRWGLPVFESMPMGGYGGWVCEMPMGHEELRALTSCWLSGVRWPLVELTSAPGAVAALPSPPRLGQQLRRFRPRDLQTHILSLDGDDARLLQHARASVRSYLRRVESLGYSFEVGGNELLSVFSDWYRRGSTTWKSGASYLYPDGFFNALLSGGRADIWLANHDGRQVGAAIFLRGKFEVLYQASGTEKVSGPVSAMDALIWSAARHYRDQGYLRLNMGASDGLESVRRFKEKFGAVPVNYRRVTYLLPWISTRLASSVALDAEP